MVKSKKKIFHDLWWNIKNDSFEENILKMCKIIIKMLMFLMKLIKNKNFFKICQNFIKYHYILKNLY